MTIIAVTGASGFVGRHLCDACRHAGVEVRALAREALAEPAGPGLLGGVDALVHLAGRVHRARDPAAGPGDSFEAANVGLARWAADACLASGVRRLVFVSSAGVLGASSPPGGFTESSPVAPHDAYTRSKLAAERLLQDRYADRLETVIIRPPLVYGPGAKGSFSRLMQLAITGWPLPMGSLTAPRSLVSVRNLCDLLLQVARSTEARGLRLLVADAETTSVAELVRSIRAADGRPARLFAVPPGLMAYGLRLLGRQQEAAGLTLPFVVRPAAALATLGWSPPHRLQDEIRWVVCARRSGSLAA